MRMLRSGLVLALTLNLIACGDGSNNPSLGREGSLYQDRESLLSKNIEEREDAISLTEAEAIKTPVLPISESEDASTRNVRATTADATLLSKFDLYPAHTISSRVLTAVPLVGRDKCLQGCVDNNRCGGVTYLSAVGLCYLHGPTQSNDKLSPIGVQSKKGQITFDTYVISSRNVDYNEDGNFYMDLKADGAYRFKILYSDGTASAWKVNGLGLVNQKVPYKNMEGVVLSATNGDGLEFKFINLYVIKCYGDCSYPDFKFPLVAWSINEYVQNDQTYHLSTDCDDEVTDGCSPSVGMGFSVPNQDPPYNEFGTFGSDSEPLSLSKLADYTQEFVW